MKTSRRRPFRGARHGPAKSTATRGVVLSRDTGVTSLEWGQPRLPACLLEQPDARQVRLPWKVRGTLDRRQRQPDGEIKPALEAR
jgi:hypothetical protein